MDASVDWPTTDLLSNRREATPDKTALIDIELERTWSYREFDRHVDHAASDIASALDDCSDESRSGQPRVGVLMNTRPAFARLLFAAIRTGTVLVPLNVRETASEIETKIDRTDPQAVLCERETASLAASSTDRPIFSIDEPADDAPKQVGRLGSNAGTNAIEPATLERSDPLCIMFTSGTTGEPKGVRLTVGNLTASATASAFRLGVLPSDRWLCCLPMYHMGGLAPAIRSTLYGTTLVVQRTFDPERTARAIDEYDITGVSLVPTMLNRLLDAGWTGTDSLRSVLLGGAPASSELLEQARSVDIPVYPTYGMTETASQISTATPDEVVSHEGTAGQPLLGTDVTVVDETTTPLDPGESGELVVSGPTVTPGYLDDERTTRAFCEYGLRTGDFGSRDRDGRLWIGKRRSDRIVTGGENVDPSEVADVLTSHPDINASAVVGLSDPEWGERVAAVVVPNSAVGLSVPDILEHCEDQLAGFKHPKTIARSDSIPRTASGTVDRDAVRELLQADGVDTTKTE